MIDHLRKGLCRFGERLKGFRWPGWLVFILILISFFSLLSWRLNTFTNDSLSRLEKTDHQLNLLLLGAGGGEGQVKDLTDTIIFVSLDWRSGKVTLISLPRDIWVASMRAKLNTAYHYGSQPGGKGGLVLAKEVVSELLGQPVHYAVLVDFAGLVEVVDLLGGLEIEVERSFDDSRYPIPGKETDECEGDLELACRYEHLHFDDGVQIMDGDRALKFVRSRFAEGEEGTDFARNQRQQKVILALQKKILSWRSLSFGRLKELFKLADQTFVRDIRPVEYPGLALIGWQLRHASMKAVSLEEAFVTPAQSARYDFQWVLIPAEGWESVQGAVRSSLSAE